MFMSQKRKENKSSMPKQVRKNQSWEASLKSNQLDSTLIIRQSESLEMK